MNIRRIWLLLVRASGCFGPAHLAALSQRDEGPQASRQYVEEPDGAQRSSHTRAPPRRSS